MSDTKVNCIDLKKILEANNLYKSDMTLYEMELVHYSFKCKQALEAEGLYENGMSDQDIKDIYNTLKKSEETATNDHEYRDILNQTNTNCSNVDMLIEESNTTNDMENNENLDVTTVQPINTKHQVASKSFSSVNEKHLIGNINVLMETKTNHPLLKLPKVKYSNASILYYHQNEMMKLPLNERAKAVSQYLLNLHIYIKNNNKNEWSIPIEPCQKKQFNGDLCVDFIPEIPEEDKEETEDVFKNSENIDISVKDNSYVSNRPKRLVKRKNYLDQLTDDDEDVLTPIKKTKSSDDLNSNENSPEFKWISKKKKNLATPKLPSYFSSGSDRINKIFDKLKWGDNSTPKSEKKSAIQNLQDTLNLTDSDEEIMPTKETVTTVNIHKEEDQLTKSKNGKIMKAKKTSPRKRGNFNKLTIHKNSATKENESPEIPVLNFYAKNSDVDESNNNKLENSEDLTDCPICNRPFPVSKIEVHASSCMQYEGKDPETFCDICHEYIPDKKFQSHKYECLRKITEASTIVEKPTTRSQRSNGFLCHICDKFIVNASEIQHASNCIAKV